MKRILISLLFLTTSLLAQTGPGTSNAPAGVQYVLVAPSGSCGSTAILQFVMGSGQLWGCVSGTWTRIGAGSGNGTVTSVTLTGDGVVLSATPSTAVTTSGTLTAALATAGANTVLGNFTGSTATPTYGKVTSSQTDSSIAPAASPVFTGQVKLPDGTQATPGVRMTTNAFGGYSGSTVTAGSWIWGNTTQDEFGMSATGTGQFGLNSAGVITFGSSNAVLNAATMNADTAVCRNAGGVIAIGNGASCNTNGRVKAAGYMSVGTTFTGNAGCGEGSLTGGATAGKFTTSGTTSCTIVITMGNSASAPNGWNCTALDLTTVGDLLDPHQTATTQTTVTLVSGTIVANDVIQFSCMGY